MLRTIDITLPALPADRPRYLMGVGTPEDILEAVARGIDMFDCVLPTRSGRHGQAFTRLGKINLSNAKHADDPRPLDPESPCPASANISRAYLHHLVKAGELLGMMLLSWANIAYYQELDAGHPRRPCEAGALRTFLPGRRINGGAARRARRTQPGVRTEDDRRRDHSGAAANECGRR